MLSLIISIIALGFIIAFHELGHFAVAKLFGVGVIEYSIGMGPRILSFVKGNTRYSLKAMPFGGSCMMLDEDGTGPDTADEERLADLCAAYGAETLDITEDAYIIDGRYYPKSSKFSLKPAWQRFLVVLAGPVFNFFLAFVFGLIITMHYGYDRATILETDPGMAMSEAGIESGDTITGLGILAEAPVETGKMTVEITRHMHLSQIDTARDISLFMTAHDREMQSGAVFIVRYLDFSEGNTPKTAGVVPSYDEEAGRYRLGFTYSTAYAPADNAGEVVRYAAYNVIFCMRSSLESIRMLIRGRANAGDVVGPVGMVAAMDESMDEAASSGGVVAAVMTLINIMILISGSLGFMNLLPIPALDGGRLLFILVEMIIRRPVPREIESRIHAAGMLLLLGLMAMILFNDVISLIFR